MAVTARLANMRRPLKALALAIALTPWAGSILFALAHMSTGFGVDLEWLGAFLLVPLLVGVAIWLGANALLKE
jgi:hypothetical protein